MADVRPMFIAGQWKDGAECDHGDIINPASEASVGRVALAAPADVEEAIDAAGRALPRWRETPVGRRAMILRRAAAILTNLREPSARALTSEQGKTRHESRQEYDRAIETLLWHANVGPQMVRAGSGSRSGYTVKPEPIGVVGAFIPWNYPAVIAARKVAAALIAGCSVVLKGSEAAPSAAVHLVRALNEAGLPPGVLNLVFGDPAPIADAILASPVVRAVSFTGSTAVGRHLGQRAAAAFKRSVLELGGHAPVVVCADADLDAAVAAVAAYKFECAGQSCNAPSRVYVEAPAYERFVDLFSDAAGRVRVGDGALPATEMGPLANPRRLEAMRRLTDDAVSRGGRVLCGGARLAGVGYFWPPTVLTDVPDTAAVMTEEPFGPLLPISHCASCDEAIERANASAYGLAAYVFTRSPATADRAASRLEAGSVGINQMCGVPPDVGIAGIKDSGYGYEGGRPGIEAFLNMKVVACNGNLDAHKVQP